MLTVTVVKFASQARLLYDYYLFDVVTIVFSFVYRLFFVCIIAIISALGNESICKTIARQIVFLCSKSNNNQYDKNQSNVIRKLLHPTKETSSVNFCRRETSRIAKEDLKYSRKKSTKFIQVLLTLYLVRIGKTTSSLTSGVTAEMIGNHFAFRSRGNKILSFVHILDGQRRCINTSPIETTIRNHLSSHRSAGNRQQTRSQLTKQTSNQLLQWRGFVYKRSITPLSGSLRNLYQERQRQCNSRSKTFYTNAFFNSRKSYYSNDKMELQRIPRSYSLVATCFLLSMAATTTSSEYQYGDNQFRKISSCTPSTQENEMDDALIPDDDNVIQSNKLLDYFDNYIPLVNPFENIEKTISNTTRHDEFNFTTNQAHDTNESCLEYDHYNGVTLYLGKWKPNREEASNDNNNSDVVSAEDFEKALKDALKIWKNEGRKGIWIHIPKSHVDKVAIAIENGFDFHMIGSSASATIASNELIVSRWLPSSLSSNNRLPKGPTHQIGVGCIILHPFKKDHILVVQEKTGPAAANKLWKMPTGLADPNEDIHLAAMRELKEETNLDASFNGIVQFRQSHPTSYNRVNNDYTNEQLNKLATRLSKEVSNDNDTTKKDTIKKNMTVSRKVSDLFFVCQMSLNQHHIDTILETGNDQVWNADLLEIHKIQWMSINDYCNQSIWLMSPAYKEMNNAIVHHTQQQLFIPHTAPLRHQPTTNNDNNDSSSLSKPTWIGPVSTFYKTKKSKL